MLKKLTTMVALLALLTPCLPAQAETIYLKDGTRVQGTIVKEDASSFTVQAQAGSRKVAKQDVEVVPPPDPLIAVLLGLLIPGAGQAYAGDYGRAAVTFGTGLLSGVAGYMVARQGFQIIQPDSLVIGAISLSPATLIGAYDAYRLASERDRTVRYHIDY